MSQVRPAISTDHNAIELASGANNIKRDSLQFVATMNQPGVSTTSMSAEDAKLITRIFSVKDVLPSYRLSPFLVLEFVLDCLSTEAARASSLGEPSLLKLRQTFAGFCYGYYESGTQF